jgi:hypothetical protein
LKPFTVDGEGKSINLYNLKADKFIQGGPVKNQCSQNFFYGTDLGPEKALSELEGQYSRIAQRVREHTEISSADVDWLRIFSIVQTRRTAQAVAQLKQFMDGMADEVFRNDPDQRPTKLTHDELVVMCIRSALNFAERIDDLKFIVLENKTNLEFSISDHPSVMSNRFSFESPGALPGFGLASSGAFLSLPMAPHLAAFFFDIGVYTVLIPIGSKFVEVKDTRDVEALNELQQLNAEQNIYFSSWAQRERFIARSDKVTRQRVLRPNVQTFVRDQAMPEGTFRLGTEQEEALNGPRLLQASSQHPRPRLWPQFLKKKKPIIFSDVSATGPVRKPEWLRPGAMDESRGAPARAAASKV